MLVIDSRVMVEIICGVILMNIEMSVLARNETIGEKNGEERSLCRGPRAVRGAWN